MQVPAEIDFTALIQAAQQNDEAAYDQLYTLYADVLFRFFYARCRDYETAEDLTSNVFLRLVEALPQFTLPAHGEAAFNSWLFRIARNQLLDHYRRSKYQMLPLDERLPSTRLTPDAALLQCEYEELHHAIRQLKPAHREIVLLRFVHEQSLLAIATATGLSVGAVKAKQHRAIQTLGQLLQQTWHGEQQATYA